MREQKELELWAKQFREFANIKGTSNLQLIERWKEQNFSAEETLLILDSLVSKFVPLERRISGLDWLNLSRLDRYPHFKHKNFEFWLFSELAKYEFFEPRLHHITSIRGKSISEIPERIDRFFNLRRLYSYGGKYARKAGNVLTQLPESIGKCRQLRSIQLQVHQLQELPRSIGQLNKLRELRLHSNDLKALPEEIGNLGKLEYLDLSGNQIRQLPESIGNLPSNCFISLRGNPLEVFPKTIQMVEITAEQWNRHKEDIIASKYLKYCRIYHSKELDLKELFLLDSTVDIGLVFLKTSDEFPEELRGLENLRYLYIDGYGCNVKIPEWFSEFQRLESLYLLSTEVGEFPKEILSCQNLLDLTICTNFTNPLEELPEEIGQLQKLETLNLKENHLREFPEALWSLRNLRELDLSMNGFSQLPKDVLKLKKLRFLNLSYNMINKETKEILRPLKWRLKY